MEPKPSNGNWRVWGTSDDEGLPLYYKRAIGELPEMESSKAVAGLVKEWILPGDRILDVGCGAGHYLRSLRRAINTEFHYTGVDATEGYLELARQAWEGQDGVSFHHGDIDSLPFDDAIYDIVICSNLLLHLPSIQAPISELVRVARRRVLIRTLVGDTSFRIQEVRTTAGDVPAGSNAASSEGEDDFDQYGEPRNFAYYNIYSQPYVGRLLSSQPRVTSFDIFPDTRFDEEQLSADLARYTAPDATRIMNGWQVNGYVLLPWSFISIGISDE